MDPNNYEAIEKLLLGENFIYSISNNLESINWLSMKEKQTFKIDNVFIQKVTKPKLDKNGTLLLTTGNGTISCKIMNNTYKKKL